MDEKINRFHECMEEYELFLIEMAQQEDKKYSALISNDIKRIDKTIAEQQAMLMKLDKMEKQRMSLQKEVGWENQSFQEILDSLPGSQRRRFEGLFQRVNRLTMQIKERNEKSMSFAKMSLRVNDMLGAEELQEGARNYTVSKGEVTKKDDDSAGTVFETKI